MARKINFDRYVREVIKKYPSLKKEIGKAERAWNIAFQIRALRKKRGFTQKQLAAKAGTSQPNIARIENADYESYTLKNLDKVMCALNAKVDVIIVPEEGIKNYRKYLPGPGFSLSTAA